MNQQKESSQEIQTLLQVIASNMKKETVLESLNEKEIRRKQKRKEQCARLEKKFPKIRLNAEVYKRIVEIKNKYHLNSLCDVICILIENYYASLI